MLNDWKFACGSLCIFATVIATGFDAGASEPSKYEISANADVSLSIPTGTGRDHSLSIAGGAARILNPIWELESFVAFRTGGGVTALSLSAGPVFNFGDSELVKSYYASALAGLGYSHSEGSSVAMIYSFAFGKRFPIREQVIWKPEVNVSGTTYGTDRPTINLVPVQLSFFY